MITNQGTPVTVEQAVRIGRIVLLAMALGLIGFTTAAAIAARPAMEVMPEGKRMMIIVMFAMTLACAVAYFVIRRLIVTKLRTTWEQEPQDDPVAVCVTPYFMLTVIFAALAEGPALFAAVVLVLTAQWAVLIIPGLALLAMMFSLPSRYRIEQFASSVTGTYH